MAKSVYFFSCCCCCWYPSINRIEPFTIGHCVHLLDYSISGQRAEVSHLFATYLPFTKMYNKQTQTVQYPCEKHFICSKNAYVHMEMLLSWYASHSNVLVAFFLSYIKQKMCVLLFGNKTMFVPEVFSKERVNRLLHCISHARANLLVPFCSHWVWMERVHSSNNSFIRFSAVFAFKMKSHQQSLSTSSKVRPIGLLQVNTKLSGNIGKQCNAKYTK